MSSLVCRYCGSRPYVTACPSYFRHIENCKRAYENGKNKMAGTVIPKSIHKEDQIHTVNNYYFNINATFVINPSFSHVRTVSYIPGRNAYSDYEIANSSTKCLEFISSLDAASITSVDHISTLLEMITAMEDGYLDKMLNGTKRNVSSAYSLYADIFRKLKDRLSVFRGQGPIIEEVGWLENDMLEKKKRLELEKEKPPNSILLLE